MSKHSPVAALTGGESAEKFEDAIPKINRQRQDRAELDHDRVHLPEAVVQVELEERFDDPEMSGRAHRQKFRQAFDNTEQDRQQKVVHLNGSKRRTLNVERPMSKSESLRIISHCFLQCECWQRRF